MEFLAESDECFAQEKMELEKAAILQKRKRATAFLLSDGKNVEERKAQAEVDTNVQKADDDYCACIKAYETLKAKRQRAELVIDIWRTLEASRRKL